MEEEKELFPEVEGSDMDLNAVGKQLEGRKVELMDGSPGVGGLSTKEA